MRGGVGDLAEIMAKCHVVVQGLFDISLTTVLRAAVHLHRVDVFGSLAGSSSLQFGNISTRAGLGYSEMATAQV